MSSGNWKDIGSLDSQAIASSSDAEVRPSPEVQTTSTQDAESNETPGDWEHTELIELGREFSPGEVIRISSNPELLHGGISEGFDRMTLSEVEANKPPTLPADPTHRAHFPNQYPNEPGHGRYSSPAARSLPDLHSPGHQRRPNVRNPVSDTWRDDAYEKLNREGVITMSDIESKQNRWKCENCNTLNERGRGVCKKCGDEIALEEFQYAPRGPGESGVLGKFNAVEKQTQALKQGEKKELEIKGTKEGEGIAAVVGGAGSWEDVDMDEPEVEEPDSQEPVDDRQDVEMEELETQEPVTEGLETQQPEVQEPGDEEEHRRLSDFDFIIMEDEDKQVEDKASEEAKDEGEREETWIEKIVRLDRESHEMDEN